MIKVPYFGFEILKIKKSQILKKPDKTIIFSALSINLWTFGSFKNGKVTLLGALQPRNLEKVNGLCPRSLCHAPLPAQLVAQSAGGVGYSILKG